MPPQFACDPISSAGTTLFVPKPLIVTKLYQNYLETFLNGFANPNSTILSLWDERTVQDTKITYEVDPIQVGIQQYRGQGAPLPPVQMAQKKRLCTVQTMYWGEKISLSAQDWLLPHYIEYVDNCGLRSKTVDLSALIADRTKFLARRRAERVQRIKYDTIVYGGYTVATSGAETPSITFPIQQTTVAIPWTDRVNSTPFSDIRRTALANRLNRLVGFDQNATIIMNPETFNLLVTNTNQQDRMSVFGQWCCTVPNIGEFNKYFLAAGLPKIEIDDNKYLVYGDNCTPTYVDGTGGFLNGAAAQYYIPTGYVIWVADVKNVLMDNIATLYYTLEESYNTLDYVTGVQAGVDTSLLNGLTKSVSVYNYWSGVGIIRYPAALLRMQVI